MYKAISNLLIPQLIRFILFFARVLGAHYSIVDDGRNAKQEVVVGQIP
jgi:hypothetical protein